MKFLCFLKPIWQADSWILFYISVLFDNLSSIWGFQLFQALHVHILPQTWDIISSSSNDCRLPATDFANLIWVSATLPANTWGLYGRVICSQLYQRTLLLITSFLWPTWRFTKHRSCSCHTGQSHFLSFRFLGTVLLWKLSEVFFVSLYVQKPNYQCLLRFKFPSLSKLCQLQFSCIKIYELLSINYTRTNLLMLYQEFLLEFVFFVCQTHTKSIYLPQS